MSLQTDVAAFLEWYRQLYGDKVMVSDEILPAAAPSERPPAAGAMPESKPEATGLTAVQHFHREIEHCLNCRLGATRTHFVFGMGNEDADIMFVGEAPGRDEDLQGLPFVGRAGQLLNKLLTEVGLRREDVYIANILKCRPPNNRDPQPDEVAECLSYLHRQIELVQPKILVSLGRISGQNLLQTNDSLTRMRGKVWDYRGTPLIITFHPAYVLRNMQAYPDAIAELNFVLAEYRQRR